MDSSYKPGGLLFGAEKPADGCAAQQVSPQILLRDRAQALRNEAARLEALADALPCRMSVTATDALNEILLRRPAF